MRPGTPDRPLRSPHKGRHIDSDAEVPSSPEEGADEHESESDAPRHLDPGPGFPKLYFEEP